jgi:predicted nucleotidyltransferase
MLPLIEAHRIEIADLCRRFHVARLELFGSAARGTIVCCAHVSNANS